MFMWLLITKVDASNHTKCVYLSNRATFINLQPNEYRQEFYYYPFAIKLDRCVGSCNTLNDVSNKVCVPNKTEDLNLDLFNTITTINESKTKHISCKCKWNLMKKNVIQINSGITINVNVSVKSVKHEKKIMFGILLHVVVKMENI